MLGLFDHSSSPYVQRPTMLIPKSPLKGDLRDTRVHLGVRWRPPSAPMANSPLVVEVLVLREVLNFACSVHLESVVFESDNLQIIELCRGERIPREIKGIIEYINNLKQSFTRCAFSWVGQDENTVAHSIASISSHRALFGCWVQNPPPSQRPALIHDGSGV